MPHVHEGSQTAGNGQFAIVVARYNESITNGLLSGALSTLTAAGVEDEKIDVVWVPGAFEIPLIAHKIACTGDYAAVLCLGAVIRGATTHDQHINRAVSLGIVESSLSSGVPVLFGVLTCDSLEQALERSGEGEHNKGAECARSALEMASLLEKLAPKNE
ncbi:MAG: 6,7-dimethyl-8-ribityllumazine synthase [Planctomycetota bacterium]|nr:MAG: 6,7-dimethyl-8-ribityllumazine synthase [Planctomycetota bacterium]REJ94368.1 MAG: 6,7-dimethyl-8-ribityllumazine synthase [Planctomycetota bacterium]REK22100.1 MAG: 6,7-dimethyl-8-ribityllumazine synthase [Planctomycetota bacterium]REK44507.1 MAG: 6,7-dimethyl-8-ribityllumazine synthase [Planctomycetota bacterium]